MELKLVSQPSGKTATLGRLYKPPLPSSGDDHVTGQLICRTLEDVVREPAKDYGGDDRGKWVAIWKKPGETAIPSGRYKVTVTYSPKFKRWLPVLHDVPGFTGIRIHAGNTAKDTEGCILVGNEVSNDARTGAEVLLNSATTLLEFMPLLGECSLRGEEVWITIVRT